VRCKLFVSFYSSLSARCWYTQIVKLKVWPALFLRNTKHKNAFVVTFDTHKVHPNKDGILKPLAGVTMTTQKAR
jgi:hypothetical protein